MKHIIPIKYRPSYKIVILIFCFLSFSSIKAGTPIKLIPNLQSITFYERTGGIFTYTFDLNSYELNNRFINHMNSSNNDFEGWVGNEYYDVFYSDSDGGFNVNGEFISIEATYHTTSPLGGLNISEIEFNFSNGTSQFGSYIASYLSLGSSYLPGSEENAADCNINTHTFMGQTSPSDPQKLRVTIGYVSQVVNIEYLGCENDGYSVIVNGNIYNESNPSGVETLTAMNGCDSIVNINLYFAPQYNQLIDYEGCENDGYYEIVNNVRYDKDNPTGVEYMNTVNGCDSIIYINMIFHSAFQSEIVYQGCEGDNYSVTVNGITYNEGNPKGVEFLSSIFGCDSTLNINLLFYPHKITDLYYEGCESDGFSYYINGNIYDEYNPSGIESMLTEFGCDSIIVVEMMFYPQRITDIYYEGCEGDGYSISINGSIYNGNNPIGIETLTSTFGCDSIVNINLVYNPNTISNINHERCYGDGFSVIVGNSIYNQNNPNGIDTLKNSKGCDSIVVTNLVFKPMIIDTFSYFGCQGDGFSVIVNGNLYNEINPFGKDTINSTLGCDSVKITQLLFSPTVKFYNEIQRCKNDGYFVQVGNNIYNQNNPNGIDTLISSFGCDSIVMTNLFFNPLVIDTFNYFGCRGDGFSITVNGNLYNELNPFGIDTVQTTSGCDSLRISHLFFSNPVTKYFEFKRCKNDGFSFQVGNNIYNQFNPVGIDTLISTFGCDSIVITKILFLETIYDTLNYIGCKGDGFSIIVNGKIYNENYPTGVENLKSVFNCDSIVVIDLKYFEPKKTLIEYNGCDEDGYFLTINGTLYNQDNPNGVEHFISKSGCDSTVYVTLNFSNIFNMQLNYIGCKSDNYSINVNNNIYNEKNPEGTEIMQSINGCDSIINVKMIFNDMIVKNIHYNGCINDGFEIKYNGNIYNEKNPKGTELLISQTGCDTLINIDMAYNPVDTMMINYEGCIGDGYYFEINGNIFNEKNPVGIEYLKNHFGCDSIININLKFIDCEPGNEEFCKIYVPNIFSPDDDGFNDYFILDYNEFCEFYEFQVSIFDRWGNLIFSSNDMRFKWDGKKKDIYVLSGVYAYLIKYRNSSGNQKIFGGDITLIR